MATNNTNMLRSFAESLGAMPDGLSKPFLEAAMNGLRAIFESDESIAADAGKAKAEEDIASIDKSIELTNSSAESLKNAQQHRIEATRNSPLASSEEKSSAETKAAEKTQQIQQGADAKIAELNERKRAIETDQAAKQAEQSQSAMQEAMNAFGESEEASDGDAEDTANVEVQWAVLHDKLKAFVGDGKAGDMQVILRNDAGNHYLVFKTDRVEFVTNASSGTESETDEPRKDGSKFLGKQS